MAREAKFKVGQTFTNSRKEIIEITSASSDENSNFYMVQNKTTGGAERQINEQDLFDSIEACTKYQQATSGSFGVKEKEYIYTAELVKKWRNADTLADFIMVSP